MVTLQRDRTGGCVLNRALLLQQVSCWQIQIHNVAVSVLNYINPKEKIARVLMREGGEGLREIGELTQRCCL